MKIRAIISKQSYLYLILYLLISMIFVGCSSSKSLSSSPVSKETTPSGPQYGGTLTISRTGDALVLGSPPKLMRHIDRVFVRPAIETLIVLDESGEPQPWLAAGWQVDGSNKTITFTLRKGVKFHDGTDFNAEAVKWNLDQYMGATRGELVNVDSVDIVDDYTIRLNLSELDNLLVANLATTPGMMVSPTAFEKDPEKAEVHPVGTGPFKFVSWERDVKQVYEKFDDYWQEGKPYLDRIVWEIIADPMVQNAAFKSGDVDVSIEIDPRDAKSLEAEGKYKISKTTIPLQLWGLYPDSNNPNSEYANKKVRQAIWHAIDMETIVDIIGVGYWEALNQSAVKGSWVYNPNVQGFSYDPEKARQLLAEAGYPNGFKTTLNGLNISPHPDILVAVQGYLAEVGIEATVDAMDKGRYDAMVAGGGGWQNGLTLLPSSVVPNEFAIVNRLLSAKVRAARLPSVFAPKSYEDLIEKAIIAPDFNTLKELVHQLQVVGTDEHTIVNWFFATTGIASKHEQVQDDGLFETMYTQWSPEDTWIKK